MYQGNKAGSTDLVVLEGITSRLRDVLGLIDEAGMPADIGAHVDLAICRLEDLISDLTGNRSGMV
jgi:hypothetical protein